MFVLCAQVETIGDAYMVVGGVPEPNKTHAEAVANMGLDMVEKAREVKSPATGKPLQVWLCLPWWTSPCKHITLHVARMSNTI